MVQKLTTANRTKLVSLEFLKPHPRQHEFFSETSDAELEELANDLQVRGQQEPIHICVDGTIVRGHRRVKAATLLGWKNINAIIRHDLDDPSSNEAVQDLIDDNVKRRQLDELELARCYRQLKLSCTADSAFSQGDLRDRLAIRLKTGKSGRSLDRLQRLLDLPRDIQELISAKLMTKQQAEKILQLEEPKRDVLFADLRTTERVKDVLRRHGVMTTVAEKSPEQLGEELLGFFGKNLKTLRKKIKSLDRLQARQGDVVDLLEEATSFLTALTNRKRTLRNQALDSMSMLTDRILPDKLSN